MKHLRLIKDDTTFAFIKWRFVYFSFAIIIVMLAIFLVSFRGLNFGTAFTGGVSIQATLKTPQQTINVAKVRSMLKTQATLTNFSVQKMSSLQHQGYLIQISNNQSGKSIPIQKVLQILQNDHLTISSQQQISPIVGHIMITSSMWAISLALITIFMYLWFRFEWQFALVGLIALLFDITSTLGFFSLWQLNFTLTTVAAILTIAGYSINDTVVIFDHVRESLIHYKRRTLSDTLDIGINMTLSRTFSTSITTLLVLLALLIFGGTVIRGFVLALIWGVVVGTFSSIGIAVPLLKYIRPKLKDSNDDKDII